MFNTLKQILLKEIQAEALEAKAMLDEIQSLEREIKDLSEPEKNYEYKFSNKKYSFYEKYIGKKYKKKYKERKIKYIKDMHAYMDRKKYLEDRLKQLRSEKDNDKLREIIENYNKIKNAKNIKELGYSFEQVIEFFKKKNIPLVLDPSDTIIENEAKFDKLEDLVLVRKTDFAPNGNIIKTAANAGATKKRQIQIGEQIIEIEYHLPRPTLHFSINSEVKSHENGNWDDSRYAIIIPFDDVSNITHFRVEDTFTVGDVDIKKGYLLCPVDEVEKLQENNPNLIVIGYKGNISPETGKECVTGLADKLLSQLGYKHEVIMKDGGGRQSWENETDFSNAMNLVQEKRNVSTMDHNGSTEGIEEDFNIGINEFKAIIDKLFESNIDYEPSEIASQLTSQLVMSSSFNIQGGVERYCYNNGEFLYKTITALWIYDIELPSYLTDIISKKDDEHLGKYGIDEVLNEDRKRPFQTIDNDTIEYIENMKKRKEIEEEHFSSYECLKELIVYETLKQVKALKQVNVNKQESAKTL